MTSEISKDSIEAQKDKIHEIPLDQIERDDNQLRKEFREDELEALAETIKNDGQIQPILVTKGKDGKYKIVDGERRWRALDRLVEQAKADTDSQTKQPSTIKAIYIEEDNQLLGILGNIVRNSYNPMETADAIALIKRTLGKNATDDAVAKRIGKSRTIVVEYNSLLNLPKKIQKQAREDSCVPFRKLKVLAADKKNSDVEKIAEYETLHKKYTSERNNKNKNTVSSITRQKMDTRRVVAVRKKLEGMKTALDGVQFGANLDGNEKDVFLKSLQEIIDTANATLKRLS